MKKPLRNNYSGQAMIIAILSLGGAILGATALAGFLMLYTIRNTTDSENSAKAIFAADSGVDWAIYSNINPPASPVPVFGNGAVLTVTCYDATGVTTTTCDNASATTAIAEGNSNGARRAFLLYFSGATTTVP